MVEQFDSETITDSNFKLLSVAALQKKVHNGITIEELYRDAERKFDILIELLSDTFTDNAVISKFGYSIDELKQMSLLIFNRLISNTNFNPYMILCVSEGAPLEEIKRRRNKLLYIFHPDRNPEESANGTRTRQINEAYNKIAGEYSKAEKKFKFIKTTTPYYFPYKKKKLALFLLFVLFILAFLGFMKQYYFFNYDFSGG